MSERKIQVSYQGGEARIDRVLLEIAKSEPRLREISRSQLKKLIESGAVQVAGKPCAKAGALVKPKSVLEIDLSPLGSEHLEPSERSLPILFEDEHVVVIDKPAGISMHPGAGIRNDTVANVLVRKITEPRSFPDRSRPGIVHRLDKDTTGVVVVAKTVGAHAALATQFAKHSALRKYLALVFCTPRAKRAVNLHDQGSIDAPLGRHPTHKTKIAVREAGRRAVTHWKVVRHFAYARLLEVRLETGRTHQIRVHMSHVDSPVIGDKLYGEFTGLPPELKRAALRFGRQALHAYLLDFDHPVSGKRMHFESPLPEDFDELIARFEAYG